MEQLIVTPDPALQLIVGKLLPFLIIGLVDVGLVVAVATFVVPRPGPGQRALLFALSLVFMLTTLGLGLFISTISRTQQQAMMTTVFFMMPMMLLSGFVFPIENMPELLPGDHPRRPDALFFRHHPRDPAERRGLAGALGPGRGAPRPGARLLILSVLRFQKKLE